MRIVRMSPVLFLFLMPALAFGAGTHSGDAVMLKGLLSKMGFSAEPQPVATAPSETLAQLRDAAAARLRAETFVDEVIADPDNPAVLHVTVRNNKNEPVTVTVDVTNIHGRLYILRNDVDRDAALDNLAASILSAVRKPELDLRNVYANVRFRQPSPDDTAPTSALTEPLAGDVSIVFQLDTPESLNGLAHADVGEHSLDAIREAARDNILREMSKLSEERIDDRMVAYRIEDNPPLTPAIVLTDAFWAMVDKAFPGGVYLMLRQRDEVAVIDRNAPSALQTARQLIDVAKHRGTDFLSDRIFERREGRLVAIDE